VYILVGKAVFPCCKGMAGKAKISQLLK